MKTDYLLASDAIKALKKLPKASIDLIATDPPYNLGKDYGASLDQKDWQQYEAFTHQWLEEALRALKPKGSIYIFMGVWFIAKLFTILQNKKLLFNGWITWHYTQGMGRKKGFSPRHEDILFSARGQISLSTWRPSASPKNTFATETIWLAPIPVMSGDFRTYITPIPKEQFTQPKNHQL